MWTCLKCGTSNAESLAKCQQCGNEHIRDRSCANPSAGETLFVHPRKQIKSMPVGMTRRFSVGTLMILMTLYAVIFSCLKIVGAGLPIYAGVTIFVAGIALGQILMNRNHTPRGASLLSGYFMGVISGIVTIILGELLPVEENAALGATGTRFVGSLFCVCGGPLGYLAGSLIAGIFLFREREEQPAIETDDNISSR